MEKIKDFVKIVLYLGSVILPLIDGAKGLKEGRKKFRQKKEDDFNAQKKQEYKQEIL